MLGLISPSHPHFPIPNHQTIRKSIQFQTLISTIPPQKFHTNPIKISQWRRRPKATKNGGGATAEKASENSNTEEDEGEGKNEDDGGGEGRRPKFNLKWLDLIVDRDPDNIVAVALTGVIAWASLRVLSQLFFISAAILVAAIKYSFIAALLIFILITLL